MALSGKLTKKFVENLGAGRHGDGGGLYLVVDPSGPRWWIVRVSVFACALFFSEGLFLSAVAHCDSGPVPKGHRLYESDFSLKGHDARQARLETQAVRD